jgi:hypothetical protein
MKNLASYEDHLNKEITESNEQITECDGMSQNAKMALESLCEELLCKEAREYHDDENPEHTYEGYVNECVNKLNEMMGNSGYAPLFKPHAK